MSRPGPRSPISTPGGSGGLSSGRGASTGPCSARTGRVAERVREALGFLPEDVVIGHVSRLAPEKNVMYLAEALRAVGSARPEVKFLFVGDGPARAELEAMMGPSARFVGYRSGEDLADHYAAADLFAFASLTETFGNVVLEALATGLPTVAVRAGGGRGDRPIGRIRHPGRARLARYRPGQGADRPRRRSGAPPRDGRLGPGLRARPDLGGDHGPAPRAVPNDRRPGGADRRPGGLSPDARRPRTPRGAPDRSRGPMPSGEVALSPATVARR